MKSHPGSPSEACPRRPRGRPVGSQAPLRALGLERRHVHYLRARLEGLSRKAAATRYLAADETSVAHVPSAADERRLLAEVRLYADATSIDGLSFADMESFSIAAPQHRETGNARRNASEVFDSPVGAAGLAELPPLDTWIEHQCQEWGVDHDFMTESEWLHEYASVYGIGEFAEAGAAPLRATSTAPADDRREDMRRRHREALRQLGDALDGRVLSEHLAAHLAPDLVDKLARTAVRQVLTPVQTLSQLRGFIASHGPRWWRHVPGLGRIRAAQVSDWLRRFPLPASGGGSPTRGLAGRSGSPEVSAPSPARFPRLPESKAETAGADAKPAPETRAWSSAVDAWLKASPRSETTCTAYRRWAERFWLWCTQVAGRLHPQDVQPDDLLHYAEFLAAPPSAWIQLTGTRASRRSPAWRPLKGPLAASSIHLEVKVLTQMLHFWWARSWLRASPTPQTQSQSKKIPAIDVSRSYTPEQVEQLLSGWRRLHALATSEDPSRVARKGHGADRRTRLGAASLRRTRLVLWMGLELGLTRREMLDTRLLDIATDQARIEVPGQTPQWVRIDTEVRAALLAQVDPGLHCGGPWRQPLIRHLPRRALADGTAPYPAPSAHTPLSASALRDSFVRFLRAAGAGGDTAALGGDSARPRGSLHWLRHTFGLQCAPAPNGSVLR